MKTTTPFRAMRILLIGNAVLILVVSGAQLLNVLVTDGYQAYRFYGVLFTLGATAVALRLAFLGITLLKKTDREMNLYEYNVRRRQWFTQTIVALEFMTGLILILMSFALFSSPAAYWVVAAIHIFVMHFPDYEFKEMKKTVVT